MIAPREDINERVDKDGYPLTNPFLSGITRADKVRIYAPLCRIYPYPY